MAEATVTEQDEAAAASATGEPFEYGATEGRKADEDGGEQPQTNGKKTLSDLAAEAPDAEPGTEGDEDPQPRLFGAEAKVTASVKGKKPEVSKVKFKSAAIDVAGQFHSDDLLELRFIGQVDKVEFVNKRDKAGKIVAVARVHHVSASAPPEQLSLSADLLRRRAEFVADALGVDVNDLVAAQDRAATEVQPAE
jgi:hypothetical protein